MAISKFNKNQPQCSLHRDFIYLFNKYIGFFFHLLLPLLFALPQCRTHPTGLTTQMTVGQMPVGGARGYEQEH